MMGHSSIRTTQIYAEITNQKVSRDLAVLSETTKGKFSLPDDGMPSRVFKCGNYSGWKISVAEYNAACRKDVMKFTKEWEDLTHKMGYWVDKIGRAHV